MRVLKPYWVIFGISDTKTPERAGELRYGIPIRI
jgi:hypothetical protein